MKSTERSGVIRLADSGIEHHCEDFTEDLALWRMFYGASGGEIPA
jgi:hypothetical protein